MISLSKFMEVARQENCWSPDAGYLTRHFTHLPVFIYGPHKYGLSSNHMMKGADIAGVGWTTKSQYTMYLSKDKEPIAFERPEHPMIARVYGEIWVAPLQTIFDLDKDMCNTLHFDRKWRHVQYYKHSDMAKPRMERQEYISEALVWEGNFENLKDFVNDGRLQLMPRVQDAILGSMFLFEKMDDKPNRCL